MRPSPEPSPDSPSFRQLDRRLIREWDFKTSRPRAILTAREVTRLLAVRGDTADLEADLWPVWHAAEVLWDSNEFEDAKRLVALWRETIPLVEEKTDAEQIEARIWAAILSAELEHRLRRFHVAIGYVQFALAEIRRLAGGSEELRAMLQLGAVTPITEMACAALAIGIPAGRLQFASRPTLKAQYLERWIEDAQLILRRDLPPPLRRIHALVIQSYFALAEKPLSVEVEVWLDRLERFDDLVRPKTPRGQETRRLRNVARAQCSGNDELALEEARAAKEDLADLQRHLKALDENGWWPPAVNE